MYSSAFFNRRKKVIRPKWCRRSRRCLHPRLIIFSDQRKHLYIPGLWRIAEKDFQDVSRRFRRHTIATEDCNSKSPGWCVVKLSVLCVKWGTLGTSKLKFFIKSDLLQKIINNIESLHNKLCVCFIWKPEFLIYAFFTYFFSFDLWMWSTWVTGLPYAATLMNVIGETALCKPTENSRWCPLLRRALN